MKKILLASAGVMVMSAGTGYAACIPTPSCSSLGYESSSSCEGGIKCPFGNAWNCTLVNKITEIENKITEIINNAGNPSCQVGYIYYSDKTCSVSDDASKTPIGVVVYVDGQGYGQVMALKSIGSYAWGGYGTDIPTLTNFTSPESASYDLNSCANTQKIMAAGDKSKYPAAWAAHEYKTEGTNAGDWCLPAAGVFTSYYNNQQLVDIGMTNAGGTQIGTSSYVWSSSELSSYYAWYSDFGSVYGLGNDYYYGSYDGYGISYKPRRYEVRPVFEF